ncbi:hypothetical protein [Actinoplanes sp. NPDC049118]|uniref:hypothetical protein n=1 Tax=Actinoplanes sp. NPDC049118 TaxID=3155769 RepID=UPI0033FF7349
MSGLDRLAGALIVATARRWPAEIADDLSREWLAELEALRGRPWRRLTFAGSLALSPAVEEAGEEPVTWPARLARGAVPVALTLLAAALINAVRLLYGGLGPAAGAAALAVAAAVMAYAGRRATVGRVVLFGAALYAFLLAGNEVAVMPFMGWRDIAPAVAVWTAALALTVRVSSRLRASARHRLAAPVAVLGGVVALEAATIAGSLRAATALGVHAGSAPAWLPAALLPAPGNGPSGVLLGNAAAMIGPIALCTVAVVAGLLRRAAPVSRAPGSRDALGSGALGIVAGLGGLAVGELLRRGASGADPMVFGFGFLAHPAGRTALALLVGLLVAGYPYVEFRLWGARRQRY